MGKDLNWFNAYLPSTNGVYITHDDVRSPIHLCVDVCATGAGTMYRQEAYHAEFHSHSKGADRPIVCHLEAVNAVAVLGT